MSRKIVGQLLSEYFGAPVRIVTWSERCGAYVSTWALREVDVDLADGQPLSLVVKRFEPHTMTSSVKPEPVLDPLREIDVYRCILSGSEAGTARFYGSAKDETGCPLLLLEHVRGTPLWQIGEFSQWLAAADWLGRMHSRLARLRSDPLRTARLLHYDEPYYRVWPRRALHNRPGKAVLDAISERYDEVLALLAGLPHTIIHGEFHASNVLVRDEGAERVCVLDWEMAAVGPGLMDLADLTSGKWDATQRAEMAGAYRAACDEAAALPESQFVAGMRACRLHRALQWVGWSRDWSPPPEQANDWLSEAADAWHELTG